MGSIRRYALFTHGMDEEPEGRWVRWNDHVNALKDQGDSVEIQWMLRQMRNRGMQTLRNIGETYPDVEKGYVDILFDGPPAHESGRFVEVEDEEGKGLSFGEWIQRDDGYWVLRIPR